ncbi:hypothetical protein [Knoellia remsis]|uniref:hypothetical protein n=1 Tax=Knoellia remsis TaxID=407159 RepID=UPI0014745240|nr:hypothetical protein [Knoellia remsis]
MSEIDVHVTGPAGTTRAGTAWFTTGRRAVSTTFAYDPAYLATGAGYDLSQTCRGERVSTTSRVSPVPSPMPPRIAGGATSSTSAIVPSNGNGDSDYRP